jgi:hypothetical protein
MPGVSFGCEVYLYNHFSYENSVVITHKQNAIIRYTCKSWEFCYSSANELRSFLPCSFMVMCLIWMMKVAWYSHSVKKICSFRFIWNHMRWAGHIGRMEAIRNTHGRSERKRSFVLPRHRWEDIIKIYFKYGWRVWTRFTWLRFGNNCMVGFCELCNEPSGSIKCGWFFWAYEWLLASHSSIITSVIDTARKTE